ncbi:MAG: hypothetical protein IT458_09860 [Planctomycetes bacterium]|nr:hypothetical protein [Planctomycetota bacterium]
MHCTFSIPFWILAGLCLALPACKSDGSASSGKGDGVSAVQFDDIPVPDGMKLVSQHHESHSVQVGGYRYADFVYRGSDPIDQVAAYMLQRMPQHSWKAVKEDASSADTRVLRFERDAYRVECTITRESRTTTMNVQVRTNLNER